MNRSHPTFRSTRPRMRLLVATFVAAVLALALPTAAAADDSEGDAWVRVTHLVPGMSAVSVSLTPVDGGGVIELDENADYGDVGDYRSIPAGFYTVTARAASAGDAEPQMLTGSFRAEDDRAYTVAGLGSKDDPEISILPDDLRPPADGEASVRLINATADFDTVDVATDDGMVLVEDASRGEATGYATIEASPWSLTVSDGDNDIATAEVDVRSASVYTLLVLGGEGGDVEVRTVLDASGSDQMPSGAPATGLGGQESAAGALGLGMAAGLSALVVLAALAGRQRGEPVR